MFKRTAFWRKSLSKSALNKKRKGIAAIEFALIAPALFFFLIGVMELSLVMLVEHVIENATYNASRTSKTGFVAQGKTQLETVMEELNGRLGGLSPLVDTSKISVTTTSYGELSQIDQPDQGMDSSLGSATEIVVYTVSYPWEFFTPLIGDLMGDEHGVMKLSSRIVVRNEPYD